MANCSNIVSLQANMGDDNVTNATEGASFLGACLNASNWSTTSYNNQPPCIGELECALADMNETLYWYLLPILIGIGTISNVATLIAVRHKQLRQHSVCFYIAVYAVNNLLMLYLATGLEWLSGALDIPHIMNLTDLGCRLWWFVKNLVTYTGIWVMVAMTVDRYIAVCHPAQIESMCTVFMAKFALAIISVGMIVVGLPILWTVELMESGCFMSSHTGDIVYQVIWPWLSAACYTYIPLVILFVLDILILQRLLRGMSLTSCGSSNRRPNATLTQPDFNCLVLVLSMVYFLLSTPATIINVIDYTISRSWRNDRDRMLQLDVTRTIANYLTLVNPTIILFVCLIVSDTMCQELRKSICGSPCIRRMCKRDELPNGAIDIHVADDGTNEPVQV
jgi:hypothetical protein